MADGQNQVFGRRKQKHLLILASGDKVRHMTVRPWMTGATVVTLGALSIAYLTATAYLVVRDDLIGASMARQARMQHEYEDRIAALRAQVDRITSRQLLDQQVVEGKVEKLLEQQMALTSRQGKFGTVLERAQNSGLEADLPDPAIDPDTADQHTDASFSSPFEDLLNRKSAATDGLKTRSLSFTSADASIADRADRLFSKVTHSLKDIEFQQLTHIQNLTADASERVEKIQDILANTGIELPETAALSQTTDTAMGGPFVAPDSLDQFETSVAELDIALDRLDHVKTVARRLPFASPAPRREITSLFGTRVDPFLGKLALHAGIDFRQKTGTQVLATGAGVIIHAGPAGGYGIMVEVDHGDGLTTRYGHLSRTLVNVGDTISEGDVLALSGSTGRSTGPHLHYEVRRNGKAVDPLRFLNAGLKLDTYLE